MRKAQAVMWLLGALERVRASGIKKKCKFQIMKIAYLIKKITLSCVQGNESTAEAIACLNKPEAMFFFFTFLKTVCSKLEIATNAACWWEQREGNLALVIRCWKFLSLLVIRLFVTCGWKLTINHFLSLPETLHKHPFYTLENKCICILAIYMI